VAYPGLAFGGFFRKETGEIVNSAGFLAEFEDTFINDTEAGGIVTTVLESSQAFEDDILGGFPANVANNATHSVFLSEVARR
jgi:hypothetical protein